MDSRSRLPLLNRNNLSTLKRDTPSILKRDNPSILKRDAPAKSTFTATSRSAVLQKRRKIGSNENLSPPKATGKLRRSVSVGNLYTKPKRILPLSDKSRNVAGSSCKPAAQAAQAAQAAPKKKRAAWDYKGRLGDLESVVSNLMHENKNLSETKAGKEEECNRLLTNYQEFKMKTEEQNAIVTELRVELENTKTKNRDLSNRLEDTTRERDAFILRASGLNEELTLAIKSKEVVVRELTTIKVKFDGANQNLVDAVRRIEELEKENINLKQSIASRDEELISGEILRRSLHNQIQDLKGNIRVFCRVRPLTKKESENGPGCVTYPDPDMKMVSLTTLRRESVLNDSSAAVSNSGRTITHDFTFDKVFDPESTQYFVYDEISQLVQSVLDGYNVCVFAYGPTGSGKTYTMEGRVSQYDEDDRKLGMIPRAVQQIFESIEKLAIKGWQYDVKASFIEIYNERIRDLLSTTGDAKYDIKFTKENETYITNVTIESVNDATVVLNLINQANKARAVASTKCNERSSRSHSVFILKIAGRNETTRQTCSATLNLVDLAGSERVKQSGSEGERLKEAQSINKSLSNLGNVIMALAQKAEHIPYRNSKLTLLLSPYLGGNSKTLMFINISPYEENYMETLNSLRFAKTVNECHIGVAQRKK